MVKRCTGEDESRLLDFLEKDAVYHTFLLADIRNYGFDQEFQTVYAGLEEERITHVYLKFYGNLIVAGDAKGIDGEFLKTLTEDWKPDVVMGKAELTKAAGQWLPGYELAEKNLYLLEEGTHLIDENGLPEGVTMKKGVPGDEDKIHGFLMTIPEIRALYTSKEMIADRLKSGDGTHLYLERNGEIIAHVNSAAQSPFTVMLGGAAVKETERGKNYEAMLVSRISRDILAEGKKPCLFCDRESEHNLFVHIGFTKAGAWGRGKEQAAVLHSRL